MGFLLTENCKILVENEKKNCWIGFYDEGDNTDSGLSFSSEERYKSNNEVLKL